MKFNVLVFCNVLFVVLFAVCAFTALHAWTPAERERKNPAIFTGTNISQYQPLPGDIILTRNQESRPEREKNPTPGFWNHAAIAAEIDGQVVIVEIQKTFPVVVAFRVENFLARYPEAVVLRPLNKQAERNAVSAESKVGDFNHYRFAASVRLWIRRTDVRRDNCVSFVRKCYHDATGRDYLWTRPDHIYDSRERAHLAVVAAKKDRSFVPPKDFWAGRVGVGE